MLEVLWLTPVPPDKDGGGGHIRQAHLLTALATKAKVHLVCSRRVRDPDVRVAAASIVELDANEVDWALQPRWRRRLRDVWLGVSGAEPREVFDFRRVRRAMRPIVANTPADVVIVEYAGLAPLIDERRSGQTWTLTLHNLASVMSTQEAPLVRGFRRRWLSHRDAHTAERWEREMTSRYDRVLVVSTDDAKALGGPDDRLRVVPNGVDIDRYQRNLRPEHGSILFSGALYTLPNIDGATWLCTEVLPLIKRRIPRALIQLVGARPPASIVALGDLDGVSLVADVPTMAPFYEAASLVVVPLRIGSGTRLKALEGLATGRPVVGTTIGLAGLDLVDGQHALFADDAQSFADAVCDIMADPAKAEALAEAGRELVERRYSWSRVASEFLDALPLA